MRLSGIAAFAASMFIAAATSASATVVIGTGAGVLQPDENLLFNNDPAPGLAIQGWTNNTHTLFTLSGGETLIAAGGQARLDTQDGIISSPFTFNGFDNQLVGFDVSDGGLAFTSTEFRLFGGTATQATLTFVDTDGQIFQQSFAIPANGFFNAQAVDGQLIDYFSIAANGTIGDVRQIRVGGLQAIPDDGNNGGNGGVPEPATWALMIMGFGGAGVVLRRRRHGFRLARDLVVDAQGNEVSRPLRSAAL
jgi:hypothetical protein